MKIKIIAVIIIIIMAIMIIMTIVIIITINTFLIVFSSVLNQSFFFKSVIFVTCLVVFVCATFFVCTSSNPLRECPRAGRFRATLLLRTTCMPSHILKRVTSVSVYLTKTKTKTNAMEMEAFQNNDTVTRETSACDLQHSKCVCDVSSHQSMTSHLALNCIEFPVMIESGKRNHSNGTLKRLCGEDP